MSASFVRCFIGGTSLLLLALAAISFLAWTSGRSNRHHQTAGEHLPPSLNTFSTNPVDGIVSGADMEAIFASPEHQDRRLQAGCPSIIAPLPLDAEPASSATAPPRMSLGLDRKFVKRVNATLSFQFLMLDGDPNNPSVANGYEYYRVWSDSDDANIVAKMLPQGDNDNDDPVCHGVFRATINKFDPIDNWQNLNPLSHVMEGTDCKVRQGFHQAVFTNYWGEFRQALMECLALCGDVACPLVLSGLSQGGGVALIAAIELRLYNPMIITLGGMRAIVNDDANYPCADLDVTRHFRLVNTNAAGEYDSIVMQRYPPNAVHVGHLIFMDEQNYPMAYLGLNDDTSRYPTNSPIHGREEYQVGLDQMLSLPDECYPIPLGHWPVGHVCGYNDECANDNCIRNTCRSQRLNIGEVCDEDLDCVSGRCQRPSWYLVFQPKECV